MAGRRCPVARRRRNDIGEAPQLPADIACGPVPEVYGDTEWIAHQRWATAGAAWSGANGLGHFGWYNLLASDVIHLVDDYKARRRARLAADDTMRGEYSP